MSESSKAVVYSDGSVSLRAKSMYGGASLDLSSEEAKALVELIERESGSESEKETSPSAVVEHVGNQTIVNKVREFDYKSNALGMAISHAGLNINHGRRPESIISVAREFENYLREEKEY